MADKAAAQAYKEHKAVVKQARSEKLAVSELGFYSTFAVCIGRAMCGNGQQDQGRGVAAKVLECG